uniref:Endonuclease-reverse transcriptase n=1 Tax=Steinernema glaseri TaxID=37863 RepID=A0A1I7YUQ7_9BILA
MCVLPAMLYGCETWALTKSAKKKLAAAQRKMERQMAGVTILDRRTNEWLQGVTKVIDVVEAAAARKWRFAWKLANEDAAKQKWSTRIAEWRPPLKRPAGRPRTRWRDDITKAVGTRRWHTIARSVSLQDWCSRRLATNTSP